MRSARFHSLIFICLLFSGLNVYPAFAQDNIDIREAAIITPPTVDEGIIYFFSWPNHLYAFNEPANELQWTSVLDPRVGYVNPDILPAPSPVLIRSYVLLHMGRQLWGISKVDGHPVWSVDGLPEGSYVESTRETNRLPGFYAIDEGHYGSVLTLEQESHGGWYVRRRLLGDGSLEWEHELFGKPRSWWYNRDGLWIAYERMEPANASGFPGIATSINPDTGEEIWSSEASSGFGYRSSFMGTGRIFLLQGTETGEFRIDAYRQDSGEIYKTISYEAGELIDVLQSGDKLTFMHREGENDDRLVKFLLYYTSLNPIRLQTIRETRADQPFSIPVIEGNLLLYGGKAYSVFDGNTVWDKLEQMSLVEWISDDYNIYIWEDVGRLVCWDRLTGSEMWVTPFNVLPTESELGPNFGGASMTLADGRLFIATPLGELVRVDTETGEPYPGIIKVSQSEETPVAGSNGNSGSADGGGFIWIWILVVIAAGFAAVWIFVSKKKVPGDESGARKK